MNTASLTIRMFKLLILCDLHKSMEKHKIESNKVDCKRNLPGSGFASRDQVNQQIGKHRGQILNFDLSVRIPTQQQMLEGNQQLQGLGSQVLKTGRRA